MLEKIAEYLCYAARNKNVAGVADMDIPSELCLELVLAADFLDGESDCFGFLVRNLGF